jgi:uncharacterized BrkB/YihY/UPF0761 family membrane protein
MRPRDLPQLLKEAASEWIEDGAMRLSSSLAYYAIFSLAPLLVIVISIAGLVFGEEAARGQIAQQISALAGARAGEAIQATVQASASEKTTGVLATIICMAVNGFYGCGSGFAATVGWAYVAHGQQPIPKYPRQLPDGQWPPAGAGRARARTPLSCTRQ